MSAVLGEAARRGVGLALKDRLRHRGVLIVTSGICAVLVLLVLVGPWLAPYSPSQPDVLNANAGMSSAHWLGTDDLGRDILSRILAGARPSLIAAALVVVFAGTFGTLLAIASVWFGGWVDSAIMRFANVLFAIPSLLIAVLAVAIFKPGLTAPVIALAIATSPYFARVGRSVALSERNKPYVEACMLAGFSGWRICFFHLLPNMRSILLAQATVSLGFSMIDLASLSFIGLGMQPPATDWGLMVSEGRTALLNGYPLQSISAGVMIVVSVVSVTVLGERLTARAKESA